MWVMKNWLPLVPGPALAIDKYPDLMMAMMGEIRPQTVMGPPRPLPVDHRLNREIRNDAVNVVHHSSRAGKVRKLHQ